MRQFRVEALEGRLAPGGVSCGVVLMYGLSRSIGEEIPQVHVAPLVMGGANGGVLHSMG
jgi:hypothetical protein